MKSTKYIATIAAIALGSAHAAVVFTESFESPDNPTNTTPLDLPTGWTFGGDRNTASTGIFDPSPTLTGVVGDQVLRVFRNLPGTNDFGFDLTTSSSILNHTIALNEQIDLSFNYGNLGALGASAQGFPDRAGYAEVSLLAIDGSNNVTTLKSQMLSFGSSEFTGGLTGSFDLSHTVDSVGVVGQRLAIRLYGGDGSVNSNTHVVIDDISLSVVPEPRAALLGGIGLLALLRRRKRVV